MGCVVAKPNCTASITIDSQRGDRGGVGAEHRTLDEFIGLHAKPPMDCRDDWVAMGDYYSKGNIRGVNPGQECPHPRLHIAPAFPAFVRYPIKHWFGSFTRQCLCFCFC